MGIRITAADQDRWAGCGLAAFDDFADRIAVRNAGTDAAGGYGDWFYAPPDPLPSGHFVIYTGSWSDGRPPGDPAATHADLFDGADPDQQVEFTLRVRDYEAQPEHDDQP